MLKMLLIVGVLAFVMPAMLSGSRRSRSSELKVTSSSLGIQVFDQKFSIIIPKNTPIPAMQNAIFQSISSYQTTIYISIYEGEDTYIKNNNFLGEFTLDISSKKKGEGKFEVTLELDEEFLHVTATAISTGASESMTIKSSEVQKFVIKQQ